MQDNARLVVDGAMGEGGGQILRSALALAACHGCPVEIVNIRSRRRNPGLQRQHLTAVRAVAAICGARVEGAELDSMRLSFVPGPVQAGEYRFDVGSAGSTTLVLQTILPALLTADRASRLRLIGGTHNPLAPSYDFIETAFLPVLNRMGARVTVTLVQPGFYPRGGGIMEAQVMPTSRLLPLDLCERGAVRECAACALLSRLPDQIGQRELAVVSAKLGIARERQTLRQVASPGPGNALTVSVRCEHITEVFTAYGERGVPAEVIAERVVADVRRYLAAGVPVGEHLADQLLLPLALAGGGSYRTLRPSGHLWTNIELMRRMANVDVNCQSEGQDAWRVVLRTKAEEQPL